MSNCGWGTKLTGLFFLFFSRKKGKTRDLKKKEKEKWEIRF